MREVFVYDAVRTPRGRATKGALSQVKPVDLLAPLFHALPKRSSLDLGRIDDVILGCVTQTGDQGANIAKVSALYAGWPDSISGATVNRYCSSGLDAIHFAALKIAAGASEAVAAGGVESMSKVPIFADAGPWFADPEVAKKTDFVHMGISADLVASESGITRDELDAYAARSQQRAAAAAQDERFARSLIPVTKGQEILLDHDEAVRPQTTREALSQLPAFFAGEQFAASASLARERYPDLALELRHSIATAPAMVDAASLLLLGSREFGDEQGLVPRARFVAASTASVEPVRMLTGNIDATHKVLAQCKMTAKDIEHFEVNESFAAIPLQYQREFNIADDHLNPCGGAIALGHPLGATGGILAMTAIDELHRTGRRRGLVTICGGAGVATSAVFEV